MCPSFHWSGVLDAVAFRQNNGGGDRCQSSFQGWMLVLFGRGESSLGRPREEWDMLLSRW
jgi:hypothetical protein